MSRLEQKKLCVQIFADALASLYSFGKSSMACRYDAEAATFLMKKRLPQPYPTERQSKENQRVSMQISMYKDEVQLARYKSREMR